MLNPDNVTPIKPNPTSDQTKDMRSVRPSAPPQSNKNFSKIVERDDNRRSNDEDGVHGSDEKEETPSLFDLSAKKKPQIKINAQLKSNPDTTTETEDAVFNEDALQENEPAPSNLSSPSSLDKIKKTLPFLPQENSDMALNENEETPNAPSNDRMALNSPSNDQMAALNAPSNDQMELNAFLNRPVPPPIKNQPTINPQLLQGKSRIGNRPDVLPLDTDATVVSSKNSRSSQSKDQTAFAQENDDLSYINPSVQPVFSTNNQSISSDSSLAPSKNMQDIVDQIVKTLQTIEYQGKTDTIVTLQYPPILQGANVVLTSFETAPKEFNIAFTNLGTAAKQLLDQRLSQDSLTLALENKGFVVHMITPPR